ncbi:MAG: CRISPR-associated protein Csm1 [Anaerophaga sp.]|nr:CRISPR-associated protein Csm1 [Anaerophaga sp.]
MENKELLLIKGDVAGIQHYIFSVKNDGAARRLKNRSLEVKESTLQTGLDIARELDATMLTTGGGYFLLKAPKPSKWEEQWNLLRKRYESKERKGRLNLVLSFYEVPGEEELNLNYSRYRHLLESQAGKDKLQQGKITDAFFDPYRMPSPTPPTDVKPKDIPTWDDCQERLYDENEESPKSGIIDFDHLAAFARQRTGSDLLAALKLDVDNLGKCFEKLKTKEASDKLSKRLNQFFGEELKKLREKEVFHHNGFSHRYKDNIYLVFAGGDDTFLLGGFDAVLQFTKLLQNKFSTFSKELLNDIPNLEKVITFSASIIFFKPSYPLLKMASTAEHHLNLAKEASTDKNRISVLGQPFKWHEFSRMINISNLLDDLVRNHGASKAVISRIRESRKGFAAALRHSDRGRLNIPSVWRLFYFIRNVKPENKEEIEKLIKEYEALIMNAFMEKENGNPMLFPVAARIAEYKLKNFKS